MAVLRARPRGAREGRAAPHRGLVRRPGDLRVGGVGALAGRGGRTRALPGRDRARGPLAGGDAVAVLGAAPGGTRAGVGLGGRGLEADAVVHLPLGRRARRAGAQQPVRVDLGRPRRRARDRRDRPQGGPRRLAWRYLLRPDDPGDAGRGCTDGCCAPSRCRPDSPALPPVKSGRSLADRRARDRARDDEPLDLRGALEDRVDLGVARPALDGVLAGEAVAAEDLHGLAGDLDRGLGGHQLRHRALGRVERLALAGHPRRPVHQQAAGVDARPPCRPA